MGQTPWQLQRGLMERRRSKSRHREPRPIAENLPSINVNDLKIPRDYKRRRDRKARHNGRAFCLPTIGHHLPEAASSPLSYL